MRDICIKQMVESWFTILKTMTDVTAQSLCLEVVAAFVDWIDLELVANDEFMPIVIQRLANNDTSEAAIHAVTALMQKGMPPAKKFGLILALGQVLRNNNLISLEEVRSAVTAPITRILSERRIRGCEPGRCAAERDGLHSARLSIKVGNSLFLLVSPAPTRLLTVQPRRESVPIATSAVAEPLALACFRVKVPRI